MHQDRKEKMFSKISRYEFVIYTWYLEDNWKFISRKVLIVIVVELVSLYELISSSKSEKNTLKNYWSQPLYLQVMGLWTFQNYTDIAKENCFWHMNCQCTIFKRWINNLRKNIDNKLVVVIWLWGVTKYKVIGYIVRS